MQDSDGDVVMGGGENGNLNTNENKAEANSQFINSVGGVSALNDENHSDLTNDVGYTEAEEDEAKVIQNSDSVTVQEQNEVQNLGRARANVLTLPALRNISLEIGLGREEHQNSEILRINSSSDHTISAPEPDTRLSLPSTNPNGSGDLDGTSPNLPTIDSTSDDLPDGELPSLDPYTEEDHVDSDLIARWESLARGADRVEEERVRRLRDDTPEDESYPEPSQESALTNFDDVDEEDILLQLEQEEVMREEARREAEWEQIPQYTIIRNSPDNALLITFNFTKIPGDQPEICSICQYELSEDPDDDTLQMPEPENYSTTRVSRLKCTCNSIFHFKCINHWLANPYGPDNLFIRSSCPNCRDSFRIEWEDEEYNDGNDENNDDDDSDEDDDDEEVELDWDDDDSRDGSPDYQREEDIAMDVDMQEEPSIYDDEEEEKEMSEEGEICSDNEEEPYNFENHLIVEMEACSEYEPSDDDEEWSDRGEDDEGTGMEEGSEREPESSDSEDDGEPEEEFSYDMDREASDTEDEHSEPEEMMVLNWGPESDDNDGGYDGDVDMEMAM